MTHILLDRTIKGSHFLCETAKWDCFQELQELGWFTGPMCYMSTPIGKKKKKERKIYTKN